MIRRPSTGEPAHADSEQVPSLDHVATYHHIGDSGDGRHGDHDPASRIPERRSDGAHGGSGDVRGTSVRAGSLRLG